MRLFTVLMVVRERGDDYILPATLLITVTHKTECSRHFAVNIYLIFFLMIAREAKRPIYGTTNIYVCFVGVAEVFVYNHSVKTSEMKIRPID